MTQPTDLIERLRRRAWLARSGTTTDIHLIEDEAISAMEAQARQITEMQQQESELCTLYGLAQAECKKLRSEVEGLRAARMAYASEFPPDGEGEPDIGSIHQNIRAMKAEIEGLRKDAERYAVVRRGQHWSVIDGIGDPLTGDRLDAGIDAVIAAKGQP